MLTPVAADLLKALEARAMESPPKYLFAHLSQSAWNVHLKWAMENDAGHGTCQQPRADSLRRTALKAT